MRLEARLFATQSGRFFNLPNPKGTLMSTIPGRIGLALQGIALGAALACQPAASPKSGVKLETDDQKAIYAIGTSLAGGLAIFNLNAAELAILESGIEDGITGKKPKINAREYRSQIQALQKKRMAQVAEAEKTASTAFLEEKAAESGAVRTDSGLIYIEKQAGHGESPKADSTVKVNYEGTLRDGTVFDSSIKRGTAFTTRLSGVIPCWTEGLQKMKVGGKARLVCPANIAYGDRGAPPHIKPGAALVFDVELIEIVK